MIDRPADAIGERLRKLLDSFSQSEIARRTGIPQSSLSRYFDRQKVPAEICSRIVTELGVSPGWILTGQGTTFVNDLNETAAASGAGLREVLESLNALSRSTLNSLGDDEGGTMLADLDQALQDHAELRLQLARDTEPVLRELDGEVTALLKMSQVDEAQPRIKICQRLLPLCTDASLSLSVKNNLAYALFEMKRTEESIELRREIFRESFASSRPVDEFQLVWDSNFISTLRNTGHLDEARRVARALMEFRQNFDHLKQYWMLAVGSAICEIECGNLRAGVERLLSSLPRTYPEFRDAHYPYVVNSLLLQATVTLPTAVTTEAERLRDLGPRERLLSGITLLRFGIAAECARGLQLMEDVYPSELMKSVPSPDATPGYAPFLQAALSDAAATGDPLAEYDAEIRRLESESSPAVHAERLVFATQLARVCDHPDALERLAASERAIDELPEGQILRLTSRWVHARNVLTLVDASTRESERLAAREHWQRFLDEHVKDGYLALRLDA